MDEQQAIENSEGETPPESTVKPTKKKVHTRGFRILRLERLVSATFSIMAKVFIIVLIGIAAIFIVRELSNSSYAITQVNVPSSFVEAGYTGPVVAKRISNHLKEIIRVTRSADIAHDYADAADDADVSIDMVGIGVPVRSFIELVGNAIGITRKKKITTDVTLAGNKLILVLNIAGETSERVEAPLDTDIEIPLKALITEAAERILKYTNDGVLDMYYGHTYASEKRIELGKYRLEKFKGNAMQEVKIYASWARALVTLKKLEDAERRIKQGLAIDPNSSLLYASWAYLFQNKGDFTNAIVAAKKAHALLPADAFNSQRASSLGVVAVCFSYNGQSDSAFYYYEKALKWDVTENFVYYNLAYEYLIKGDTTQCFDHLEKALAYGFDEKYIADDPDMAGMLNHPRLKELMQKYSE